MKIEVCNMTKRIKGTTVLKNISLSMEGGKIYGLRGKNGSGKTMLLRSLSGLIRPSEGKIMINQDQLGKDIDFPLSMGMLIENPSFLNGYTGFQNLKMLTYIRDNIVEKDIRQVLNEVGLDPYDKRKYRKYSLGMKQRLGIACALMGKPDLILLDEPFNALDPKGVELVKKILIQLKTKERIIVVACHDIEELEILSDTIYQMDAGMIKLEEEYDEKI